MPTWRPSGAMSRARATQSPSTRTSRAVPNVEPGTRDLEAWLIGLRDDAITEADMAFPAERLATQQAQVLRRLEAMERPARVIAFPRLSRTVTAAHSRPQRWVAAAAAAGLIVGIAAGQLLNLRQTFNRSEPFRPVTMRSAQVQPGGRASVQPVQRRERRDVDVRGRGAFAPPRASSSIDALTPRMREQEQPK